MQVSATLYSMRTEIKLHLFSTLVKPIGWSAGRVRERRPYPDRQGPVLQGGPSRGLPPHRATPPPAHSRLPEMIAEVEWCLLMVLQVRPACVPVRFASCQKKTIFDFFASADDL